MEPGLIFQRFLNLKMCAFAKKIEELGSNTHPKILPKPCKMSKIGIKGFVQKEKNQSTLVTNSELIDY